MDRAYLGVAYESWQLIFQAISAAAVVIGVFFGVLQLRSLATQSRFTAMRGFQEILSDHAQLFNEIVETFPIDATSEILAGLSHEQLDTARRAVDAQNLIGQMIEEGVVDARSYFRLTHVQIIRLCHILKPYTDWVEARQGAPYGRRIHRVGVRALRFHDMHPVYRNHEILITRPDCIVSIHKPASAQGPFIEGWRTLRYTLRSRLHRF